ncbi:MAG TPA: AraC family transcriptional regulator [Saprospiraceae bacterium]|nr:AraC family transcriptional regulator [Saprospiraceae bacterium]
MKIVPQSLLELDTTNTLLADGLACIISKKIYTTELESEKYLSAHAITIVLNGQMRIESHSGHTTVIGPRQMVFLPKGLYMISDILPGKKPFEALVFFFDEALIDEYIKIAEWEDYQPACLPFMVMNRTQNIDTYVNTLQSLYGNADGRHRAVTRSKLLELLHLISLTEQGRDFGHAIFCIRHKQKQSIKELMNANFDKPLAIADYAYLSGRSVSSFHRDFKRLYNQSPKKWLIERRIEKAIQLIDQKEWSITSLAFEVGYKNVSHFIKAFRQKVGISPKQYHLKKRRKGVIQSI